MHKSTNKNSYYVLLIVICSSISPYIIGGIRLESFIIYPAFIYIVFRACVIRKIKISSWTFPYLCLLFSAVTPVITNTLIENNNYYVQYSAAINTLLAPSCLLLFYVKVIPSLNKEEIVNSLKIFQMLTVFLVIFVVLSTYMDLSMLTKYFIRAGSIGISVSDLAKTMGRYTGLFSQPVEAGVFYSCSAIITVYLSVINRLSRCQAWLLFNSSCLGGILAFTKLYMFLGLPLALILLNKYDKKLFGLIVIPPLIFSVVFGVAFFLINFDTMINSYLALYDHGGFIYMITAGRLGGSDSTTGSVYIEIIDKALFTGFGIGNNYYALDSAYLLYFFQGGIISLSFYLIGLLYFFINSLYLKSKNVNVVFLRYTSFFVLLGSNGGPVINANRANIVMIFILVLFTHLSYTDE
jgi:hypothetical protein